MKIFKISGVVQKRKGYSAQAIALCSNLSGAKRHESVKTLKNDVDQRGHSASCSTVVAVPEGGSTHFNYAVTNNQYRDQLMGKSSLKDSLLKLKSSNGFDSPQSMAKSQYMLCNSFEGI